MPELPEVETVKRGLAPSLEGAALSNVRLNRPNLRYPFPNDFAERLNGATVLRLERRAKYLLAYMDTADVWVTHLGMTGRFQVTPLGGMRLKLWMVTITIQSIQILNTFICHWSQIKAIRPT